MYTKISFEIGTAITVQLCELSWQEDAEKSTCC